MRLRSIVFCAIALIGASCASPRMDSVARLSSTPSVGGGTYTSGGGLSVAADVREAGGLTQVCGVWAMSREQSALTKLAEHQVLGTGSIYMGRERILGNFLYMRRVDPAADYAGQEANCTVTKRPWRASDATLAPVIHFPRQIVNDESHGGFGLGGPRVWFRPGGPGAGDS
ncbi:hypothetical protein [uncultured Roseovarius sp.]|uniref:hypothetical protein n=1 Tax=uncultured Roseovarius sp. TaxID=293344 RepID=UPI00260F1151|nr:hypothetical protein [uncultured Roseovarius sp.]